MAERGRGGRNRYNRSRAGSSRGRGMPSRGLHNRGPQRPSQVECRGMYQVECRGRSRGEQRGSGFNNGQRGSRERGDAASRGCILDVRYERNKLYVLGLNKITTKDGLKNFMERISDCDVKHVLWFKQNQGKAIVTLDTPRITDFKFQKICEQARTRKLDYENVLIERAPMCKSIFVSGIPENTPQETIEEYFDKFGVVEKFVSNIKEVKANRVKEQRAILYFKDEKSVQKIIEKDHFLGDKVHLHVERYYIFMGLVEPVDSKTPRYSLSEIPVSEQPYFRMDVDVDTVEYVMNKCNQGLELKDRLFREHAFINCTNRDGYVYVKYKSKGRKPDGEFDEDDWEKRCREIITDILKRFTVKDIPVDKDIWEPVSDQLPQIELMFPTFSAQVKKNEDLKGLRLICLKKDLPNFEEKLQNRLAEITQTELDKTLEQKTLTDISNEKLQLLKNAEIEHILKQDVHQDLQAEIDLSKRSIFLKAPEGQMSSAITYLRKRLEEIDQNSLSSPPEIIEILKTKVGKRKLNNKLKEAAEGCAFNVDEKSNAVLFLGRTSVDTKEGHKLAEKVLVTGKLQLKDSDNELLQSEKWNELCRKLEKRSKIRCERRLTEFHVFGLHDDVEKALKEMRELLNEKKAKEGEFRFDSLVYQRLFHEFHKEEITKLEETLSTCSVKITSDENGVVFFTGTAEGVKEVKDKLNAFQDEIKEKTVNISLPGMRSFLAKNKGELVRNVEREYKCVFEIHETSERQQDGEDDSDDMSSLSTDSEDFDEDDETVWTPEKKKIMWKRGNIEEEEADSLVCSVGSNLNLSIGAVARSMSHAAGPTLQEALLKETNNLSPGEVVHTSSPGKLPCRHVVFCVCCPWNNGQGDAKKILQTLLWKCFEKASQLGSCSIALPLIGTGNLDFPYDVAVQAMIEEALHHSKMFPNSPIEEFRFIVHGDDRSGISTFEEEFRELKEKQRQTCLPQSTQPTGNLHHRRKVPSLLPGPRCPKVRIGDTTVEIVRGDITEESTDGIVSIIREDLQMENVKLGAAIAEASGSVVQEELTAKFPQASETVVTTSAGDLAVKHILHMVVRSENKRHLLTCIQAALKEVHSMELKSVSIPAVGSGGLGLSPQESAEVVLGAIFPFFDTVQPFNTVREVRIVVFDASVEDAFAFCLQQMTTETDQVSGFAKKEEGDEATTAKGMTRCCQHKVVVYQRHEILEHAITALKTGVNNECQSINITEDAIHRLSKRSMRELRRKGREEDVGLDLSQPGTITLQGFPTDVLRMQKEVSKVIHDQLKDEHKMDRAVMTSRTVQWCFLSVTGKHEPFETMANYDIETAFQSKHPSVSFTHKNLKAEIVFEHEQVKFLKTGAVKEIFRKEVIPLPHDWDNHPLDNKGREERVHLARLEKGSYLYQDVEDKFMQTMTADKVQIISIQRVQNPSMYRSYLMKKQSMDEKNGNHKNELYLFHGTGYRNARDICAHGFNRSFCGGNGTTFGAGVYFATESSYSLIFSKPPSAKGECCMFLAKVLVGKYTGGNPKMKTPPPLDPNEGELLYDSVVDSTDDPMVFVVFQDDQSYPEYLITFKHFS